MKAKALNHCEIMEIPKIKNWQKKPKLMDFLKSL